MSWLYCIASLSFALLPLHTFLIYNKEVSIVLHCGTKVNRHRHVTVEEHSGIHYPTKNAPTVLVSAFCCWLQEKFTLHTHPRCNVEESLLLMLDGIAAVARAFCAFCAAVRVPRIAEQSAYWYLLLSISYKIHLPHQLLYATVEKSAKKNRPIS